MAWNWAGGLAILSDWQDQKVSYEQRETDLNRSSEAVDTQIQNIKAQIATLIELSNKIPRKFRGKIKYELKQLQLLSIKLEHARTEEYRNITGLIALLVSWVSEVYVQYKEIFEHINVGIGLADTKQKTFIRTNGFLCDILEIERCDYSWLNYKEFWDDFVVDTEAFTKLKEQFRNDRKVNWELLQIRTWKWNLKWLRIFSVSIDWWNKEIFTVFDVTNRENERKELERTKLKLEIAVSNLEETKIKLEDTVKQLEDTVKQLETARKSQEDSESTMQHDLRAPLGHIIQGLGFLQMSPAYGQASPDEKNVINDMIKKCWSLIITIQRYLEFGKMERGDFMPKYEDIDVFEEFKSVISWIWDQGKFIFGDEQNEFNPIIFSWDRTFINLCISNLLRNAYEHSSEWAKVKIQILEEASSVTIVVNNDQVMPEYIKQNVFKKRYVSSKERDGNWLWTFSMKLIVEAHWWTISFTTTEEDGTTMYITFPKEPQVKLSDKETAAVAVARG